MNDLINSLFEALAGFFILLHCRATYRAKSSAGVSLSATLFFFVWGGWNIYYYPSLGQTFSFIGGLGVFAANLLWIGMIVYYRMKKAV
jgi:hypothetical protein